ncbi:MAG: hypothetical protein J6A59_16855 [Lachnospiraceae bacterium]|nr:hypothetical protein [Lachnospiraceae bacterium]
MKKAIYNILGFIGFCLSEKLVLLSLVGYILIFISPLFSWYSSALMYTGVSEEASYNMFQLASGQIKEKSYIAFGIMIMVLSFVLMLIEYKDYKIKLRSRLLVTIPLEIIIYIALIVIVITAIKNDTLVQVMSYRSGEIRALEYWIKDASGHCNNGVGPVLYILGLAVAVLSKLWIYAFYFIMNVKDSLSAKKG